jgi:hypothetical protein
MCGQYVAIQRGHGEREGGCVDSLYLQMEGLGSSRGSRVPCRWHACMDGWMDGGAGE